MERDILDIDSLIQSEMANLSLISEQAGLASLSVDEQQRILTRLGDIAENDDVFGVLWSTRHAIYDVVRAIKAKLNSPEVVFKGEDAEGKELDMMILMPSDIKKSGTPLTTFLQTVTAGTAYYESDTDDAKITMPDWEGRVYAGWWDPIDSPKLEKCKYYLPRLEKIIELPFDLNKEVPLIRHKAVKVFPGDSYKIEVRYLADGDDAARPIGVKIITAEQKEL